MESKERISIKNFAGIEELEMDIKPINILIGPQGVGKSVVVKLIYFFKDILNDIFEKTDNTFVSEESLKMSIYSEFIRIFEKSAWETVNSFQITYVSINGIEISLKKTDKQYPIVVDYSNELNVFIDEISIIKKEYGELSLKSLGIDGYFKKEGILRSIIKEKAFERFKEKSLMQIFVPAGRSFFVTLDENIYSILEQGIVGGSSLDMFLVRFGTLYQYLEMVNDSNEFNTDKTKFSKLIDDVLGGKYFVDNDDKKYILHTDHRKVELKNVSSGQQEALPLFLILKTIYDQRIAEEGSTLYIEEPEAHLFPTAQKAIVELLAKTYNSNPENTQLFITTHSPYILTSFNNLIYAGNIIKQDETKRDAVEKVVDKDTLLDWGQVGAYAVTKEGIKDLIDQENHIINAELLDEVSNMIGREFDQLLDIEYAE